MNNYFTNNVVVVNVVLQSVLNINVEKKRFDFSHKVRYRINYYVLFIYSHLTVCYDKEY